MAGLPLNLSVTLIKDDIDNVCFVCGIDRNTFDRKHPVDFERNPNLNPNLNPNPNPNPDPKPQALALSPDPEP